eukprot:sb/3476208/
MPYVSTFSHQAYVKIYQEETLPEPMTMLRATAEANNLSALASAQELYTEKMDEKVGGDHGFLNETDLLSHHTECCEAAEKEFNSTKKMGGPELSEAKALFYDIELFLAASRPSCAHEVL